MNKKDIILKKVLSNNERFASIFNNYFFKDNRIDPSKLKDSNIELTNESVNGEYFNRLRDLIKEGLFKTDDKNNNYVLFGIENQTSIDKYMAFRIMLYDALLYDYQLMNFKKNKKDAKIKLKPVITLVIYYGTKKWKNNLDIHSFFKLDSNLKEYIQNYKIKLLSVNELSLEELELYNNDIKQLFKFIKMSNTKEGIKDILTDNDFKEVKKEIAEAIKIITDSDIKFNEGDDEVSMCKGLEEFKKEAMLEGKLEGRLEGKEEARHEVVKTMHSNGFDIKTIAKALSLDINYVKLVLSK